MFQSSLIYFCGQTGFKATGKLQLTTHTSCTIIRSDHLLLEEDVHLFCCNIDCFDYIDLQKLAIPEELYQAALFRHIQDAQRFLTGRIIVKTILAKYLHTQPNCIIIQKGFHNKPFATTIHNHLNIPQFNISHSGKVVMAAFSNSEVGVDVEVIKEMNPDSIAPSVFSKEELLLLKRSLTPLDTFYQLWTQKEALLKALGLGLIDDTRKINLSNGMDEQFVREYSKIAFKLANFIPFENHLATVCYEKGKQLKLYTVTAELFS